MRRLLASVLLLFSMTPALADEPAKPATASPAPAKAPAAKSASAAGANDDENTLYAMGIALSQNLSPLKLTPAELKSVQEGLSDGVLGRPSKVDFQVYSQKIREFAGGRFAAAAKSEKKAGSAFLDKEAAAPGAVKQPTGFVYKETKAGAGASPKPTEKVKVHYTGTLPDGTVFDSSVDRGEPVTFPLSGVIPCWTQGLQLMKEGGKARLVCPPELAYGDMGSPPKIRGGATLAFDVELISIEKPDSQGDGTKAASGSPRPSEQAHAETSSSRQSSTTPATGQAVAANPAVASEQWLRFRNNPEGGKGTLVTWRVKFKGEQERSKSYQQIGIKEPTRFCYLDGNLKRPVQLVNWGEKPYAFWDRFPRFDRDDWLVVHGSFDKVNGDGEVELHPISIVREGYRD